MKNIILAVSITLVSASTFALTSSTIQDSNGGTFTMYSNGSTSQSYATPGGGSFTIDSHGNTSEQLPAPRTYNGSSYGY